MTKLKQRWSNTKKSFCERLNKAYNLSSTENYGTDDSVEARIHELFQQFREKESIYTDEILKTINEIDWGEYSKKYSGSDFMQQRAWTER